jgi:hypothetical protein
VSNVNGAPYGSVKLTLQASRLVKRAPIAHRHRFGPSTFDALRSPLTLRTSTKCRTVTKAGDYASLSLPS